jgi:DNA-binding response OmpR family regulator
MPVLMLTARGHVDDRVTGLDAGADDYLAKPFASAELLARVRALARRVQKQAATPTRVTIGAVEIDFEKATAHREGQPVAFTARELRMVRLLVEEEGRPVSRDRFLDVVWEMNAATTTRTVDNHIVSLRAKLEPDPREPRFIKTVHGLGYRLELLQPEQTSISR